VTARAIEEALAADERTLTPQQRAALDDDGYVVLRGVMDAAQCAALLETFERKFLPRDQWPAPREHGTRHAMLDGEADVRHACLLPPILAAVFHVLRQRFFLAGVQGRDPSRDGGYQHLHRDWVAPAGPAPIAIVLSFLEPFGAANGATRVVPGSHRLAGGADTYAKYGEHCPGQVVVDGGAGDVLILDGYLAHSGTRNVSGVPRRCLQMTFQAFDMHASHSETRGPGVEAPLTRYLLGENA
jgi:ectoine hydroxylase-related dioxygenase (phytanoyl-CoA dioxygenase family)